MAWFVGSTAGAATGGSTASSLLSTGWVRACAGQVWSVRDGYSLAIDATDSSLSPRFSAERSLRVDAPEALLVTGASCAAGGALRLTGLSFIVDQRNPTLRAESTATQRFELVLARDGSVSAVSSEAVATSVSEVCANTPPPELAEFCTAAQQLVDR